MNISKIFRVVVISSLLAMVTVSFNVQEASAYCEDVHEYIAEQTALLIYSNSESITYLENIKHGSRHEDEYDHVYDTGSPCQTITHMWDADAGLDDLNEEWPCYGTNSWQKAQRLWGLALGEYSSGDKSRAYEYLGHVAHLLMDMTVPAHAHKDYHVSFYEDDSYEQWMTVDNAQLTQLEKDWLSLVGPFEIPEPYRTSNPLFYLFYTANQLGDFFPSDEVDGNMVINYPEDWVTQVYAALGYAVGGTRLITKPSTAADLDDNDAGDNNDDGDLGVIRGYNHLFAFRVVGALYRLFEETKNSTVVVVIDRVKALDYHDHPWAPADFYAEVSIDNFWYRNEGDLIADENEIYPGWAFGRNVGLTGTKNVTIRVWDSDSGNADDQSDIKPNNGRDLNLVVNLDTGQISGDVTGMCGDILTVSGNEEDSSLMSFRIIIPNPIPTLTVVIDEVRETNCHEDGIVCLSDPDYYIKIRINNYWYINEEDCIKNDDHIFPGWSFAQPVVLGQLVSVRIELWDSDSGTADDQSDINPADGKRALDCYVNPETGSISGDVTGWCGQVLTKQGYEDDNSIIRFHIVKPNVPPSVSTGPDRVVDLSTPFNSSGSFFDPDNGDSWTGTVLYGDGSPVQALILNAEKTFDLNHTYVEGGIYTVTVVVEDSHGTTGTDTFTVTVLSNPVPVINNILPQTVVADGDEFILFVDGNDFITQSEVYWNGSPRPTTYVDSSHLEATIPSSDIELISGSFENVVVTVFTPTPGGRTSNPFPFTITGLEVKDIDTKIVEEGLSDTSSVTPSEPGEPGVSATLTNNPDGSGEAILTVATYSDNPTGANTLDVGGGYVDIWADGIGTSDTLQAYLYYPSTIDGLAEVNLQLLYFTGTNWASVRSSGNTDPVKDTTDNLDGAISGGRFTVVFDDTSTPRLTDLSGTVFTPANVEPVLDPIPDATVDEGSILSTDVLFTDPGGSEWTIIANMGDGSPVKEFSLSTPGITFDHVYADDGMYQAMIIVDDNAGGTDNTSFTVTVLNIAPVVDAGSDIITDEGDEFTRTGEFSDPGVDNWDATIDYGDGSGVLPLTLNPDKHFSFSHVYSDNGLYTVIVTVTDDDGATGSDTVDVTVNNIAPTIGYMLFTGEFVGLPVYFTADFTDPGADSHTIEWDFGDGKPVVEDTLTLEHIYVAVGDYTVTLTVMDDDGGVGTDSVVVPISFVPMSKFNITHAKVDFKKKPDDDKIRIQGNLTLDLEYSDGADISDLVTVTIGPLVETIEMVEREKKGDKWEYKRPKGGEGNIQHATIDWKTGRFEVRLDRANLEGVTNPMLIRIQIEHDYGEKTILMTEKKYHWDYKE
jgi:PKD repeat protein